MNEKVIAIIIIIISSSIILGIGYLFYSNYLRDGGKTAAELAETKAIANLQNAVPLSVNGFSINRFDYNTQKFIVIFSSPSASLNDVFDNWYRNSAFTTIPESMFKLVDETQPASD